MASRHIDKLVRSFISGSSDPHGPFDRYADLQDPTFMSFKIDFFPDGGISTPTDVYSTGGLFRPYNNANTGADGYSFKDSAAEYFKRIGAPARSLQLEQFIFLLKKIQTDAPWYFQTVSGLSDIYKIDPAINFRGKDKILTIDCLESVDLRMTQLADLYRGFAFDFEGMREVLPINLRTFNMRIHVLEMRKFNTTFGIIADYLGDRSTKGEESQKNIMDSKRKNVFNRINTALFASLDNQIGSIGNQIGSAFGGLSGLFSGTDTTTDLSSAFEAISVQTFDLRDCEFDFYTEAPGYLDTVSVKESAEASTKFKIKVGKINKIATYPFDNFIISEWTKNTHIQASDLGFVNTKLDELSEPYFESTPVGSVTSKAEYSSIVESIFPSSSTQTESYNKQAEESDYLKKKPLERALNSVVKNTATWAGNQISQSAGRLTGGVIGTSPLGNIYGNRALATQITTSINEFLTPGNQTALSSGSYKPASEILKNISLEGAGLVKQDLPKHDLDKLAIVTENLGNVYKP